MNNYFPEGLQLSMFYNTDTLNIFSDASMFGKIKKDKRIPGCYGVVAVTRDDIIDGCYRLVSDSTNNDSELKGIRYAICMADKWKNHFKYINIFCDSQISVFGLRDYIYNWRYNPADGLLYSSVGTPVANQSIFIECFYLLRNLQLSSNAQINLYHQAGHIDNSYRSLMKALNMFTKSNRIIGTVDLNFIRYISTYNNYVDRNSRSYLMQADRSVCFCDPITFKSTEKIRRTKNVRKE